MRQEEIGYTYTMDIRKKHKAVGDTEEKTEKGSFSSVISGILDEIVEKCVEDDSNFQINGDDVYEFIKALYEEADKRSKQCKRNNCAMLPELELFANIDAYYRFYINVDMGRQFCSTDASFKCSEDDKYFHFKELVESANDTGKKKETLDGKEKNKAENLLATLLLHTYQTHAQEDKPDKYFPVNNYLKSALITWSNLLKEYGKKEYGVYPFCEFVQFDTNDAVGLVIASKPDLNYIDAKFKDIDKIGPMHCILFRWQNLYMINDQLKGMGNLLKNAIGYLSYAVLARRTNVSLVNLADEASRVSKYWYSDGIEKLFQEDMAEESGMDYAIKISQEILCAQLENVKNIEVFPFDRIYIFPGASHRAIKQNKRGGEKEKTEEAGETGEMELNFLVIEAAIKSERPGDGGEFLSTMERYDYANDEQPDLRKFFDITRKKNAYHSAFTFSLKGFRMNQENLPRTLKSRADEEDFDTDDKNENFEIQFPYDFEESSGDETFSDAGFNKIDHIENRVVKGFLRGTRQLLHDITKEDNEYQLDKAKQIDSVLASLTAKFLHKTPGNICQPTYDFYDDDGICFIADFAASIEKDMKCFKLLQEAYFTAFFKYNQNYWNHFKWRGRMMNQPIEKQFKKWLSDKESKITLISFDPIQNVKNKRRYLDYDGMGFTMLLVADQDVRKDNFDIKSEFGDLEQLIRMFVSRKLREAKLKKETIRKQAKTFQTLMPSILHRVKNYLGDDPHKQKEIESMIEKTGSLLESEEFQSEQKEISSINEVYELFLGPFIHEQLHDDGDIKHGAFTYENTQRLMEKACKKYFKGKYKNAAGDTFNCSLNKKFLPKIRLTLEKTSEETPGKPIVQEAVKVLINNAIEHTAIYSAAAGKSPCIIFSFHLHQKPGSLSANFELSIVNSAQPIDSDRLKQLNSVEPRPLERNVNKESSTGIGVFIARIQLKNFLGEEADIQYYNVGENLVEAKLTLPAEIIEEKEKRSETIQSEKKTARENYILYVEDDDKIREESGKALLNFLGGDKNRLAAYSNRSEAEARFAKSWPSIVLMDLGILRNPGAESPSDEQGKRLLKNLARNPYGIPIIILSGKSGKEIEELLSKDVPDESGYRYIISGDGVQQIEKNTIISTGLKKLSLKADGPPLEKAVRNWAAQVFPNPKEEKGTDSALTGDKINYILTPFNGKAFENTLGKYREDNISDRLPDKLLIANAEAADEPELLGIISRWLLHKGLPSFYPEDKDNAEFFALASNENYRTLFLWVIVPGTLKDFIHYKFRYWCLPRNILVTHTADVDKIVLPCWKSTPHGTKGALGRLRHDIKNRIDDARFLEKFLEVVNELEIKLTFSGDGFDYRFEKMLREKTAAAAGFQETAALLKQNPGPEDAGVQDLFKNAIHTLKEYKEDLKEFIQTIKNLRYYLTI